LPALKEALVVPSSDKSVTYDKWGSWISGYAPLRDASGKTIAIVGVDMSSSILNAQRREITKSMLWMDLIVIPLILLLAFVLSRNLSKPFRVLAKGMANVAQGDFHHQLELKGNNEERVFIELFNNMLAMFRTEKRHQLEIAKKEKEQADMRGESSQGIKK